MTWACLSCIPKIVIRKVARAPARVPTGADQVLKISGQLDGLVLGSIPDFYAVKMVEAAYYELITDESLAAVSALAFRGRI